MYKRINVVKGTQQAAIFSLEPYSFIESENQIPQLSIYPMDIKLEKLSPIDIRYFIEEVDSEIHFLLETPEELTKYINLYEESKVFDQICLFHDFRTKYLDIFEIVHNEGQEETNPNDDVIIIGFTIMPQSVYLGIKSFSLSTLTRFTDKIISYCVKRDIECCIKNNIKWIQMKEFMLPITSTGQNEAFNEFLSRTLQKKYIKNFLNIFRKIDFDGYFDKKFYDDNLYQEVTLPDGTNKIVPIGQISKYFSPFWKAEIEVNDKTKTILCIHDELLNNESMNKVVYTFKPFLMQYYAQHWFEDFSVKIIEDMDLSPFKLVDVHAGRKFNFFLDGDDKNIREIDIVLEIEYEGAFKIIAIECKKTLSNKEIQHTNKKIREKVLNSNNNVFDAFVHIGCFNNDVVFDKRIEDTRDKYKHGKIEVPENDKIMDVPYYAFSISSIENYEMKIKYIISNIFKEW